MTTFYLGCLRCPRHGANLAAGRAAPGHAEVRAFLGTHMDHLDEVRPMHMQDLQGDTIKINLPSQAP